MGLDLRISRTCCGSVPSRIIGLMQSVSFSAIIGKTSGFGPAVPKRTVRERDERTRLHGDRCRSQA
jgi:hypothetical protein